MTEPEVSALAASGYHPGEYYESNPTLKSAIDLISSGIFSNGDRQAFEGFVTSLVTQDRFMALADYASYMDAQDRVEQAYADKEAWTRSAILNIARSGFFSSDRSMKDYLTKIWGATPNR